MKKGKNIALFTSTFPYGKGEVFLELELEYLSVSFDSVLIIPQTKDDGVLRQIPDNCEIITDHIELKGKRNKISFKTLITILPMLYNEIRACGWNKKEIIYKLSHLKSLYLRSILIEKILDSSRSHRLLYYSYWLEDSATIMYFIGRRKMDFSFVSRVHGFDLFEERHPHNHIPYRLYQLTYLKKAYSVSRYGMNYLIDRYPNHTDKFSFSYLGSRDYGLSVALPIENEFTIVSCSSLIPLKRVYLIIELLKKMSLNVTWIHFGDGILEKEIFELAENLPINIKVRMPGFISNEEISNYYKNNFVDLFINVSETEGLPYSIIEAMSFGIPVFATDVGGVSEIVNFKNGLLVEKDFDIKNKAKELENYLISNCRDLEFREYIRNEWKMKFSAEKNYNDFIYQITH